MPIINLTETDIFQSPLFKKMPRFDSLGFVAFWEEKMQVFRAEREGELCTIVITCVIRNEDKLVWEACEDLLGRACQEASRRVHGVYVFDLLCFDVHREIETFNFQDLTVLLMNHAQKLHDGQTVMIKYSSCYGLLTKLSDQVWGKITFKHHVDTYQRDPRELDLYLKKIFRAPYAREGAFISVIHDLSLEPIYNAMDGEQRKRLEKFFTSGWPGREKIPEIYMLSSKFFLELVSQFERHGLSDSQEEGKTC